MQTKLKPLIQAQKAVLCGGKGHLTTIEEDGRRTGLRVDFSRCDTSS